MINTHRFVMHVLPLCMVLLEIAVSHMCISHGPLFWRVYVNPKAATIN